MYMCCQFLHSTTFIHILNVTSQMRSCGYSDSFVLHKQFEEICFISTSPHVIAIHEVGVDEGIIQVNHTVIMEVFASFS